MCDHEQAIARTGAQVAAVGTGTAQAARDFRAQRDIAFPLLIDESLETYRVVQAQRTGLAQLVSPAMMRAGLRAFRGGHRQGRTGKHPLTLGATHVICPDGSVLFAWQNADPGDSAPVEEALAVL